MNMTVDYKALSDICDQTMDIALAVERLQAVTQSFADDFVDETSDEQEAAMYIAYRFKHFCRLFDVMSVMIGELENKTKALDDKATAAFRDSIDKCKAGVS